MGDPTMEQIDQLERNLRQSRRDDGSMAAATDDVFDLMRKMLANLTEARASVIVYCARIQRAESAHHDLAVMQDLYEQCKRDRDNAASHGEIFRRSWLDCRDRLEVARSELYAIRKAGGAS